MIACPLPCPKCGKHGLTNRENTSYWTCAFCERRIYSYSLIRAWAGITFVELLP